MPDNLLREILTFIFNIQLIIGIYLLLFSTFQIIGKKINNKLLYTIALISIILLTYATIVNYNAAIISLTFIINLIIVHATNIIAANYKRTREQKYQWFAFTLIQALAIIIFIILILDKLIFHNYTLADILLFDNSNMLLLSVLALGIANAISLTTAVNHYTPTFSDLEESIFIKIFDNSPNIILMLDLKTLKVKFFNNNFLKSFGYKRHEIINKLKFIDLFSIQSEYDNILEKIKYEDNFTFHNYVLRNSNNKIFYSTITGVIFLLQEGPFLILNIVDVTNEVEKKLRLQRLASTDQLTNLPNRRTFIEKFEYKVSIKESFAVVLLDLDGFKQINDLYGHISGDDVLVNISNRLNIFNKDSDVVARFGGDEFAMLLKNERNDNCKSKLEEISKIFDTPLLINDKEIKINISAGVAFYPEDGKELRPLFDKADIALYAAKRHKESKVIKYKNVVKD